MTSSWLAKKYLEKWRENPEWSITDFRNKVSDDYVVRVSRSQAYNAKKKSLEIVNGKHKKQFKKIWDYTYALLRSNEGSTVKLLTDTPSIPNALPIFQRLYICIVACKRGFLAGCRPFIGVDGCFLKGPTGGQLLAAVGRDGNNQMFPIAFAVVEGETKESWAWFFKLLLEDIGIEQRWTFMSDQQKGLIPALHELLPNVEYRFCWRHLYGNICKKFKGKQLKDEMCEAAKATTVPDWKKHMNKISVINPDAHKLIEKNDPATWTRSAFSTFSQCNQLLNNMSESFNAYILESRDKPVITMAELIREALMVRFQDKREKMKNYTGRLCPNIQKQIEGLKELSNQCIPKWASDNLFEVKCHGEKNMVNLAAYTCTCRKWDLTGKLCKHAISAIFFKHEVVEDYVSHWYTVDTYMRAYEHIIYPVPSEHLWEDSGCGAVAPPLYRMQPGRPRKLRRKDPLESNKPCKVRKTGPSNSKKPVPCRVRKTGVRMSCSNCKQYGHNKKSCKAPPVRATPDAPTAARKGKLPVKRNGEGQSKNHGGENEWDRDNTMSGGSLMGNQNRVGGKISSTPGHLPFFPSLWGSQAASGSAGGSAAGGNASAPSGSHYDSSGATFGASPMNMPCIPRSSLQAKFDNALLLMY
ncbi:hypothetical protein L1049_017316 [Liquidambar formosana]|uniref:SWIM-type domain-containing protein n=1 Tax=Liquidambar formosana TaxID=63359 RepID=A0AAP0X847_LIQFO